MKNNFLLSTGQETPTSLQGRGRRTIALSTIIVLLTGIIALASIPGADGVVHGCYNRNGNGSLRVIDSTQQCKENENALNFNQTGPQGLQGLPGSQGLQGSPGADGATGPAGMDGTSEAYFVRQTVETNVVITEPVVLLSKQVPAGNYVINAKTKLTNFSGSSERRSVNCYLSTGDVSNSVLLGNSSQINTLQDGVTFPEPATITLTCEDVSLFQGGNTTTTASQFALTAIKVNAIY